MKKAKYFLIKKIKIQLNNQKHELMRHQPWTHTQQWLAVRSREEGLTVVIMIIIRCNYRYYFCFKVMNVKLNVTYITFAIYFVNFLNY